MYQYRKKQIIYPKKQNDNNFNGYIIYTLKNLKITRYFRKQLTNDV